MIGSIWSLGSGVIGRSRWSLGGPAGAAPSDNPDSTGSVGRRLDVRPGARLSWRATLIGAGRATMTTRDAGETAYTDAAWRQRCQGKLTSLDAAIGLIRPNEAIYVSAGSAAPLGIYPGLVADGARHLSGNVIHHLLTLGEAPYVQPAFAGRYRHNAFFIGSNVREAVAAGRADYTPIFLSEIPALIRSGRIPVDVAILAVTPPDDAGYVSFGTHVDLSPAACEMARLIIVQVNRRMPRTGGPCRLHVDRIHAMVEIEADLPELPLAVSGPETESIARHVARLVPDGATLQLGIGAIPEAVLRFLRDRKDLGIHTETFSDGVVELVERGVITGRRKTLHPERIVASFVLGTRRVYDFVHENPLVELHPVEYTNDPFVIAQNDNLIAINTCLEIDLTGQVCSDSFGERFYSGIGGQVDFIRGAARSKGGMPVIAVASTAEDGTVSRIVPRLGSGAGVVTTRGDVHWVVTEYGAVNLHGRSVRERAMALISIAHPKFRPWLVACARQRNLLHLDVEERLAPRPTYPAQLETHVQAKDGTPLLLRPIKPDDELRLRHMLYGLTRESIYQRFFATHEFLVHDSLQRFLTIDYDRNMSVVGAVEHDGQEEIVGWATYSLEPRTRFAEVAFVVDESYQGRGIGTLLMRRLTEIAEARGLRGFTAIVLADNMPMLRVLENCGYPMECSRQGDTVYVRISFEQATRDAWQDLDRRA
jgi:acyl-CoA hydrolase/RimJ/RimL family protein N-acetyltransferase